MGVDTAPDIGGSDGVFPPIVLLLAQLTVTMFGLVSVFLGFQVRAQIKRCIFVWRTIYIEPRPRMSSTALYNASVQ